MSKVETAEEFGHRLRSMGGKAKYEKYGFSIIQRMIAGRKLRELDCNFGDLPKAERQAAITEYIQTHMANDEGSTNE